MQLPCSQSQKYLGMVSFGEKIHPKYIIKNRGKVRHVQKFKNKRFVTK